MAWETHIARETEFPSFRLCWTSRPGYGINPIVGLANAAMTLRRSKTVASVGAFDSSLLSERRFVEAGKAAAPSCEHGMWTFAGPDAKRGAAKYRWPFGRVLLGERVDQG